MIGRQSPDNPRFRSQQVKKDRQGMLVKVRLVAPLHLLAERLFFFDLLRPPFCET